MERLKFGIPNKAPEGNKKDNFTESHHSETTDTRSSKPPTGRDLQVDSSTSTMGARKHENKVFNEQGKNKKPSA